MPKLKQPTSLQDIAMDKLVLTLSNHYIALADEKPLDDIRQDVELIKNYVVSHVPLELYQRFRTRFGESILNISYSETPKTISGLGTILKMIWGGIVGFEAAFICYPDSLDAQMVTKLEVLHLKDSDYELFGLHRGLEVSDLYNLTIFEMTENCTDAILESIATNCPKLIELNVSDSENVTDAGLRALSPCSNLRHVVYTGCSVSLQGIDDLFSVNGRLQHMAAWSFMRGFVLSDTSIHPAIEILEIQTRVAVSYRYLRSIVRKFPNLTTLSIIPLDITGDWHALSELRKLSHLHLYGEVSVEWVSLKVLLKSIGTQILALTLPCTDQNEINSIYELCENVTNLRLLYFASDRNMNKLVIPPFGNLTHLNFYNTSQYRRGVFEFEDMPQLNELSISGFNMASQLKSMIVDHERFPNLRGILINKCRNTKLTDRLRKIAKFNNLDLTIEEF